MFSIPSAYDLFRYHSQNLAKEDARDLERTGKTYKGPRISWRCWWVLFKHDFRLEIHSKFKFSANFKLDWQENEMQFHIAPLFFSLYFTVGGLLKRDWKSGSKEIGFSLYEDLFWIKLWAHEDAYGSSKRDWREITIHWKDMLFGKMNFEKKLLRTEDTQLCLPEAAYPVHIEFYHCTWKRTRSPFGGTSSIQADMKMEKGIPVPGKGEDSWNCGDDATYGLWCSVKSGTTAEALGRLLESVVSTRKRHGSGQEMYVKKS